MSRARLGPTYLMGAGQALTSGAMTPLIPLFAVSLGAQPTLVGVVAAAAAVLPLLLGIWMGAAVDRIGPRRTSVAGAVGLSLAAALLGSARSVAWLIAGNAIAGLANMILIVASQTSVAQASSPRNRDRNFGYFAFWVSLGNLIGPLVGGFLADQFSIRSAFFACVGLALVPAAAALTITPTGFVAPAEETPTEGTPAEEKPAYRGWTAGAYREAWQIARRRDLRVLLLVGFFILFGWSIKTSFYPLYLESAGLSKASIGAVFAVVGAAQMIVRPLIGAVTWRYGREVPLVSAIALATLAMLATPFLDQFVTLAIAAAMTGFGLGFTQPVTMSMMAGNVDAHARGLALGLRMTINRLAEVMSPILFGALIGVASLRSAFFLSAAALAAGVWITARGGLEAAANEAARSDTGVPRPQSRAVAAPPAQPSPLPPDRG